MITKLTSRIALSSAAIWTTYTAQGSETAPIEPIYSESVFGNRALQCATFSQPGDELRSTIFCRVRDSLLVDLSIQHEHSCFVEAFRVAHFPGTTLPTEFSLVLGGSAFTVKAQANSSGYGGPWWYRAYVECDGSVPLDGKYVFNGVPFGRQDNDGQGFVFSLNAFSR